MPKNSNTKSLPNYQFRSLRKQKALGSKLIANETIESNGKKMNFSPFSFVIIFPFFFVACSMTHTHTHIHRDLQCSVTRNVRGKNIESNESEKGRKKNCCRANNERRKEQRMEKRCCNYFNSVIKRVRTFQCRTNSILNERKWNRSDRNREFAVLVI